MRSTRMMMMMMMVLGINRIPELDQKKEFTHFNFLDKIKTSLFSQIYHRYNFNYDARENADNHDL